jgi:hypothetical protein
MFPKHWSANDRRPFFVARAVTEIEDFSKDVTLDNEMDGRTERYTKFRHQTKCSAERVV